MSRDVMNNRPRKPWRARTALTATLLAAVLGGGSAAAHAADLKQWELSGPDRATHADAEADISGLIYKCRRQNGNPINSGVYPAPTDINWPYYWAVVYCRELRASR